jgi:hypothetical protein
MGPSIGQTYSEAGLAASAYGYPRLTGWRGHPKTTQEAVMLLWLLAVILAVVGVVQLLQGQIILAIVLFIAACLVGPGGYSIFRGGRRAY